MIIIASMIWAMSTSAWAAWMLAYSPVFVLDKFKRS